MDSEENHPILQLSLISLQKLFFKGQNFLSEFLQQHLKQGISNQDAHLAIFYDGKYLFETNIYLDKDGHRATVLKCDNLVSQRALHAVPPPTAWSQGTILASRIVCAEVFVHLGPVSRLR